jgi:HlyD family secretion protein
MWALIKDVRVLAAVALVSVIAAMALWPDSIEVDLATAERRDLEVTIDEEGETRVRDRYVVSATVSGRLERIELEPGDPVSKGAVVARLVPADAPLIDPRSRAELTAAVEAARAGLILAQAERDRADATLANARDLLRRREQLVEAGAISREDLETARTATRTAESAVRAAVAAVDQAGHQLELARARLLAGGTGGGGRAVDLRAPVSGVVLKRHHESEAVVPAGEPLVEIGDPSRIEVVSDVLSTDAVRVSPGQPAHIVQWGGGHTLEGKVRRVEPSGFMKVSALGVEEQRVNVIVDFVDPAAAGRALGDGYRVEVEIVVWQGKGVVTVPVGSLFRAGDGWAVFVLAGDRAERRTVELGHRNDEAGEILSGLQPGDTVVMHPPDTLSDGARITARER